MINLQKLLATEKESPMFTTYRKQYYMTFRKAVVAQHCSSINRHQQMKERGHVSTELKSICFYI